MTWRLTMTLMRITWHTWLSHPARLALSLIDRVNPDIWIGSLMWIDSVICVMWLCLVFDSTILAWGVCGIRVSISYVCTQVSFHGSLLHVCRSLLIGLFWVCGIRVSTSYVLTYSRHDLFSCLISDETMHAHWSSHKSACKRKISYIHIYTYIYYTY